MKHLYSYKFRLKPTKEQQILLNKHFGCCRFIFNNFLAKRIKIYKEENNKLSQNKNSAELPILKQELPWLKEVNAQSLQYSVECLDIAYKNFFRKCKQKVKGKKGFPKFKRKHGKQSFRIKQNINLVDNKLSIPKFLEGIEIVQHRKLEGEVRFATISRNSNGKYNVAITVLKEIQPLLKLEKTIGIDLNVKAMVDSNNRKYKNPRPRLKYKTRLKFLHQKLSRSVKGTKGREKAKKKLAKLYEHIHNIREDHLHKLSRKIIDENQIICLEDLDVTGMLNKTKPEDRTEKRWEEKQRHQNISDCSFYSFVKKLTYKAEWYGREIRKVSRWYPSSQLCSKCGYQNKELKPSEREWFCFECWTPHDRDINSALNILNEGINPSWNGGRAVCLDARPVADRQLIGTEAVILK